MNRIAWLQLMRLGLVEIGLEPAVFWDLTPAELMLLAGIEGGGGGALTRGGLEALMARFPDRPGGDQASEARHEC